MSPVDEDSDSTVSLLLSGAEEAVAESWRIEVIDGPDQGVAIEKDEGTVLAGTRAGADLQLTDDSVSRQHAELHLLANGVLAVDLGSRNGTRVGGRRIERALVPAGGTIKLGRTELRVSQPRAMTAAREVERFGEFLTRSKELRRTLAQLERAAKTSTTISIQGETGTGKEVLAHAVHAASSRSRGPFIVVDCSAVVEGLLESQLFGHKKGAFTGAVNDQVGAFEAANGGTLFLDELGELPAQLQPKLLRALEARTVKPVGGTEERPFDARIVTATNRDLEQMAKSGAFRADLFYRVAVVRVRIPPLRDRREDIPLLADHYVDYLSDRQTRLSPQALSTLAAYDWPGNARELRNVLESALAIGTGAPELYPEDLFGLEPHEPKDGPRTFHEAKELAIGEFERRYVEQLLKKHGGNITRAAKDAGISRNALQALMKRIGARGTDSD